MYELLPVLYYAHVGEVIDPNDVETYGRFPSYYDVNRDLRFFITDQKSQLKDIEDEVLQDMVDEILDTTERDVTYKVVYWIVCQPDNVELLKRELRMDFTFEHFEYRVGELKEKFARLMKVDERNPDEEYPELDVLDDYEDDDSLYLVTVEI